MATVSIAADELTIDFTGTASQVRGAINCVYPFTLSTALACVRSVLDLSIPNNAGYVKPIKVIAPEGTSRSAARRMAGGGGHSDPLLRDPALVLSDLFEDKITAQHARDAYGVVIVGNPPAVDVSATTALRALRQREGRSAESHWQEPE